MEATVMPAVAHRPDSEPVVLPSQSQLLMNALDAVAFLPLHTELVIWERDVPDAAEVFKRWAAARGCSIREYSSSIRIVRSEVTMATLMKRLP